MWYGLTWRNFVGGLRIFFLLGVTAAAFGVLNALFIKGGGIKNYSALLALIAGIPAIWVCLAGVMSITWLRVNGKQIEWYLWKRYLLKSCPAESLLSINGGLASAVVIRTTTGSMRLLGIHSKDKVALCQHLKQLNPQLALPE